MAKTFDGTIPFRKSSQDPVVDGVSAAAACTAECRPGCITSPRAMPIETAISAVKANHSRVRETRRPAPLRSRRAAIELTIAVKTSGTTSAFSSWTKICPTVLRSVASHPSGPLSRATKSSASPIAIPRRTWKLNDPNARRTVPVDSIRDQSDPWIVELAPKPARRPRSANDQSERFPFWGGTLARSAGAVAAIALSTGIGAIFHRSGKVHVNGCSITKIVTPVKR